MGSETFVAQVDDPEDGEGELQSAAELARVGERTAWRTQIAWTSFARDQLKSRSKSNTL